MNAFISEDKLSSISVDRNTEYIGNLKKKKVYLGLGFRLQE